MNRQGGGEGACSTTGVENVAFLAALDQAPLPMWLSDPDYEGSYFNRAWLDYRGRSLEQEIGGGWIEGIHPDDRAKLEAYGDALTAGRPFQVEYRLRRHDGEWRWMLDSGAPRHDPDGRLLGFIGSCVDITERRAAEQALRESEDRLQLAQEVASIGTFDWDVAADRIEWSPQMFRLYDLDPGIAKQGAQFLVSAWLDRIHPDDRERCRGELEQALISGERTNMSFRTLHPTAGPRWFEGRARILRDAEGRPLRMIGVNIDVTELRRAEAALADSEARFRGVAENFPGFIFRRITHPDGRIEYPVFMGGRREGFGLDAATLAGIGSVEQIARRIHPDDLDEVGRRFQAALRGLSKLEIEARILGDDGAYHWIRSISQPHPRDDGAVVWDGVMLDVTEQRRREVARERTTTMLRLGTEIGRIGTWEYDPESRMVAASAETNRLFGLPGDDAMRPLETYLERVHPEDAAPLRESLLAPIETGAETERSYRISGPDGGLRWVATKGRMVRLADGRRRLIGAMTDETERKLHEAEREAALEHRQTLLSELNHRVKNNLHLILSMLRLEAGASGVPERFRAVAERVEAIADLHAQLGFAEGAGRVAFDRWLGDFADRLRRSVLAGGPVRLELEATPCEVDLDRAVPLGLVVNELVTNAIKYAFPGGRAGRIGLRLEALPRGGLRLCVEDDGAGPSAGSPDPEGGQGTGLVLGLCAQIGADLQREQSGGLRYVVTLPGRD